MNHPTVVLERDGYLDERTAWQVNTPVVKYGRKNKPYVPAGETVQGPDVLMLVRIGEARPADADTWQALSDLNGWTEADVDEACRKRTQTLLDLKRRMLERAEPDDEDIDAED